MLHLDGISQRYPEDDIMVVGYGDRVYLFKPLGGLTLDSKAQILSLARGNIPATDDARAVADLTSLCTALGIQNAEITLFGDAQGMPDMGHYVQEAERAGHQVRIVGVGERCSAVTTYGERSIFVDSPAAYPEAFVTQSLAVKRR
jgi:hypothetical protein